MWTVAGLLGSRALRLGGNLIVTRLLVPDAFGLMALIYIFIQGIQMLSDVGISPSIVQNQRGDDPRFLNTAWTLQIIRGAVIWAAAAAGASAVARFYGHPQLALLIPVVALSAFISGFDPTSRVTVNRHLVLGKLTVIDWAAQATSIAVMVVWAWLSPTVWALAGAAVIMAAVRMTMSHALLPGESNRLAWERDALREILGFGKWIFLTSAIGFLDMQSDRLIFGKLIPIGLLGVYSIAYMLSRVPEDLVVNLGVKILFPLASHVERTSRQELRRKIRRHRWPLLLALAVAMALFASFGDVIVTTLYSKAYHEGGWILSMLAIGLWPKVVITSITPVLLAVGNPRIVAVASAMRLATLVVGLPLAFHFWGFPAAVAVVALSSVTLYPACAYGLWRARLYQPLQDAVATALWIAALGGIELIRVSLGFGLSFWPT